MRSEHAASLSLQVAASEVVEGCHFRTVSIRPVTVRLTRIWVALTA